MKAKSIVWMLVLILCVPGLASAVKKGRLIGTVIDPDGNPIEGVTVTATTVDVSTFRKVDETNKRGIFKFNFNYLDVVYDLVFEKEGYHTMTSKQDWSLEGTAHDQFVMYPGEDSMVQGLPAVSDSDPAVYAFNQGVVATDERDFATAQKKFEEAVVHDPELYQAWAALGAAHLYQNHYQEAVDSAEKAIELGATGELVHRTRWEAYRAMGDEAKALEARQQLENAVQLTEDAKKIYNEGVALAKTGDHEAAFAKFQEAYDIDPTLREALIGIATSGLEIGRNEEVLEAAETILAADPGNEQAVRIRFNAALELKNEEFLLNALVSLAPYEPEYSRDSLWKIAMAADDAGDPDRAKFAFGKVLEVDPDHPKAHYYLGLIAVNTGDKEAAVTYLSRFVELAPEDPDVATAKDLLSYLESS